MSALHNNLRKEHPREQRKVYRAGCSSSNNLGGGPGFQRQVADGVDLETSAAIILQFFAGLRGRLVVTFEEGTCAAWLVGAPRRQFTCQFMASSSCFEHSTSDITAPPLTPVRPDTGQQKDQAPHSIPQ